jgi:NAD-dependent dihydropyrimidine dehydrogenase PreA subunit
MILAEIVVDKETCDGCGECIAVCPESVYEFDDDGKSEPVNMEDCSECCSCIEVCPTGAITIDACE